MRLPETVGEPEVDEARTRHVDARHVLVGAKSSGDRFGKRARVLAGVLGQYHRRVGREIAMGGVARRLDRDARQIERAAVFAFQIKPLNGFYDSLVEIGEDVHGDVLWKSGHCAKTQRKRAGSNPNPAYGQTSAGAP